MRCIRAVDGERRDAPEFPIGSVRTDVIWGIVNLMMAVRDATTVIVTRAESGQEPGTFRWDRTPDDVDPDAGIHMLSYRT